MVWGLHGVYFPVIFLFNKWQDDAFPTSPRENKLMELDVKKTQGLEMGSKRDAGKRGCEFQGSVQSLLGARPVISAYNRDGKLQAVTGQCHLRFATLTPCIQRLLHQT